ncbi:HAD family hydrolase [Cohnella zeiphila]|uniref:HAD-IA family hydrolase n=1 Tax=Cohnella zeiphila TaxID=2761120 RepID=A0A7X0SH84_9BACL|nr:HAD-IA family hydrolase [Cohnella zeiphila]MBB6729942.1 HAD-IA family hydrolase [Cohnella zeiphila]
MNPIKLPISESSAGFPGKAYRAVLFDLDDTLLDYGASIVHAMRKTCGDHGLFRNDPAGWEAFWAAFTEHNTRYWLDFTGGGAVKSMPDVLKFSFRDALAEASEPLQGRLAECYWHYFCETCLFEEGADVLLSALAGKYPLGIVSNGIGEAQRRRLKAGRIEDRFRSVVVSDEVGLRKPDAAIFERALAELEVKREEVLFVGDSLAFDYEGAIRAGIDFCWYNRRGEERPQGVRPTYAVAKLAAVAALL